MDKVNNWVYLWVLALFFAASAVADESVVAEESLWKVDPFFGEPFQVRYIDTDSTEQSPSFHATLIKYPWKADQPVPEPPRGYPEAKAAVLYIHGFNDYYIQREMATKMDSAGYAFYAIDLHKYGRSYRKGERIGEIFNIAEYNAELDSAVKIIKEELDGIPVVFLGHSTGGLIVLTYANDREKGGNLAAIVLNSPFLEMNQNFLERKIVIPLFSLAGKFFPNLPVPRGSSTAYGESLHKDYRGEWDFNTDLKALGSIPVNAAWLRAIHKAHHTVQEPLQLKAPILVMRSSCSIDEKEWVEEYTRCDGVLDVEHIKKYGATLGENVTDVEIQDGLHDLLLSKKPVRDNAYNAIFQFLGKTVSSYH